MVREIFLSDYISTLISDEDFIFLFSYNWGLDDVGYVRGWVNGKSQFMHEIIAKRAGIDISNQIVHVDSDLLNNQRENLKAVILNKRNRLYKMRGYLGGAMDKAPDAGVAWRRLLIKETESLGVTWFDPTNKPIDIGVEDIENMKNRRELKRLGDYDLLSREMKIIRCVDLRMVDISDFLVVNLDTEIHTCGTYEEIFLANRQKKPIILHIEQGKKECPDWLFATLPHQIIFSTWEEVIDYLKHVAHNTLIEHHKRWYFFNLKER